MKISNFKRIVKENFKSDYSDLIDGLGLSLNKFAEDVIRAMNSNLNDDNLNFKTQVITVTVNSSGIPKSSTAFKKLVNGTPSGIQIIKCEHLTNSRSYPTGAPFITYSQDSDLITVEHITGLVADNQYRLTIKIFGP